MMSCVSLAREFMKGKKMEYRLYPSLAAGDILDLRSQIKRLEELKIPGIHIDVMDGHYVKELTFGSFFLRKMREVTNLHLDVHIMVSNPDQVFEQYLDAGADTLSFHPEMSFQPYRLCSDIIAKGKKVGIALNPGTSWTSVEYLLPLVHQVTVMTVNPGASFQSHLTDMHRKIAELASFKAKHSLSFEIQVDGGVSSENIKTLFNLGARVFVSGGSFFKGKNEKAALQTLLSNL